MQVSNVSQDRHESKHVEQPGMTETALANLSETLLANKVACTTLTVMVSVICAAYALEVIKGNRGFYMCSPPLSWHICQLSPDGSSFTETKKMKK